MQIMHQLSWRPGGEEMGLVLDVTDDLIVVGQGFIGAITTMCPGR